ncbi:MAG: TolC family outer membrane protein [Gammaproteobacteria bacterium]
MRNKRKAVLICSLILTGISLLGFSNALAENLKEIYQLAVEKDPVIKQAAASRQAIEESRLQSRAALLPNINFSANTTENSEDRTFGNPTFSGNEDYNSHGYSLSLVQPIYHHEYYVQLRQAKAGIRAATATYSSAEQNLIVRVAEAYFNVLAAIDNLEFARAEKNAIARQLEQTKQRFEVGLIAITDVHESQAAFDLSVAGEINAQNQLSSAREALSEITNSSHKLLSPLTDKMPLVSPDPQDIDQWTETALKQNYQLIASRANLEATREEVNRNRAGHYPTLDLVANRSNSNSDGGSLGGSDIDNTSISLQLNVPLYQGGLTSSQTREARYLLEGAKESVIEQRRAVKRQTRDAYLTVQATISRVKALNQALVSTQSALSAAEAGLEVGTRTTVDVLASRRELFRAQRDFSRARYDYVINSLRLKLAAGLVSQNDIDDINNWLE